MKIGIFLGSYEKVEEVEDQDKIRAYKIKNELIPYSDHPRVSGGRNTKLQSILYAKENHLSKEENQTLFQKIRVHYAYSLKGN